MSKRAAAEPAAIHLSVEQLAAENKRLKQALEAMELRKREKLIKKQKRLLEQLQVKHALQVASAEHEELKQVAKAVSQLNTAVHAAAMASSLKAFQTS